MFQCLPREAIEVSFPLAHILLAGLLALAGPAHAESVLRAQVHARLDTPDPFWSGSYISRDHGFLVFDTLLGRDAAHRIQPQMVESWTVSEDQLTYTFQLREGLRFHDGAEVTATDCVVSLIRWSARDAIGHAITDRVAEMKALDQRRFRIALREPYPLLLSALAKSNAPVPFILPRRQAELDPSTELKAPIGSGPFIAEAAGGPPSLTARYRRNPAYVAREEAPSGTAGGKRVLVDRLEWHRVPDQDAALNALLEGRHDMIAGVPFSMLDRLAKAAKRNIFLLATEPVGHQAWLRINHLQPPFDDIRARRALQLLVDQARYMRALVGDHPSFYRNCAALFGCDTPLATDVGGDAVLNHDLSAAKQLLRAAGYKGEPLVLLRPAGIPDLARLGDVTRLLLTRAGATVEVVETDWDHFVAKRASRAPAAQGGWNLFHTLWSAANIADPETNIGLWTGCAEGAWFGWPCDEALERLRRSYATTAEAQARIDIAHRVQAGAHELVTHVPLGEFRRPIAYRGNLGGFVASPVPVFWNIEKR